MATLCQLSGTTEGLLSGKNLGVDATTLEPNAALKSIVRRDGGARYDEHTNLPGSTARSRSGRTSPRTSPRTLDVIVVRA
jgi:hypothetical protein